ncbi:MAG: hypothetical protein RBQ80_04680 [Methanocorpusculum sp.]|jgi:hypothetical protein|nr:hypothetical protein [Methanocorpusculum sp.]
MVSSGIFTTLGETVQIKGNFAVNSVNIAEMINKSDISLYIAVNSSSILFGTRVSVQKQQSRPHAVIYLEEHPREVLNLRREILDFFSRCNDALKQNNYSILPENTLLKKIIEESAYYPQPFYPPEDIMDYTYGRLCVGKKITCLSKDLLRAIDYLVSSIEKMPQPLMKSLNLAITKMGFGQADVIVTDMIDVWYQINLDEGTVRSKAHPEYYMKFIRVYNDLSADDYFKAIKELILQQYGNKYARDAESRREYYTFLANEKISTSVPSLNEAISDVKLKNDPKKGLLPRVFGKDKSEAHAEKDLKVKFGNKILHSGDDYYYNPESNLISINNKCISGDDISRGEAGSMSSSQQKYGYSGRTEPSTPSKNNPNTTSFSQQTRSQNIVKKPAPSQLGGNSITNSLPKNLAIFGVGDTGFHHLFSLAKRQEINSQYTENGYHLDFYSLLDDTVSQKLDDINDLEKYIQFLPSKNCIFYTDNPKPVKLRSSNAETFAFICSLSDLNVYNILNFIDNLHSRKAVILRKMCLFLILNPDNKIDNNDLPSWTKKFTDIVPIELSADQACDDAFFNTFICNINTADSLTNVQKERECTNDTHAGYTNDIQACMQNIQMRNTRLKKIEPLIEHLPFDERQRNSGDVVQSYRNELFGQIETLRNIDAIQVHDIDNLESEIKSSLTLDNLQEIVIKLYSADNSGNLNEFQEFKKEQLILLTTIAELGKRIDSISDPHHRKSLLNFIFEPKIDDKKFTQLTEDLSHYLKSNQQSAPSSEYQNKLW